MKTTFKIMLITGLLIFIAAQFYQPAPNIDKGRVYTTDFIQVYTMPDEIKTSFQTSCYDCHSNNTNYTWHNYIQPSRILVENHIRKAKEELNFNEWGTYSNRKQLRLLSAMKEQIESKQMPLSSYTLIHEKAKLDDQQIKRLASWLQEQEKISLIQ